MHILENDDTCIDFYLAPLPFNDASYLITGTLHGYYFILFYRLISKSRVLYPKINVKKVFLLYVAWRCYGSALTIAGVSSNCSKAVHIKKM